MSRPRSSDSLVLRFRISVLVLGLDLRLKWEACDGHGDQFCPRMPPMLGPLPSYRPEFPPPFLEQAETIAGHRTVPYQLWQRAALVLLMSQQPLVSSSEAAPRGQLPPRSVRRWRH